MFISPVGSIAQQDFSRVFGILFTPANHGYHVVNRAIVAPLASHAVTTQYFLWGQGFPVHLRTDFVKTRFFERRPAEVAFGNEARDCNADQLPRDQEDREAMLNPVTEFFQEIQIEMSGT